MAAFSEKRDGRLASASSISHLAPDDCSIPRRPSSIYSQSTSIWSSADGQQQLVPYYNTDNFDPSLGATPHSPFYTHPMTQTSLDQLKCELQVRYQPPPRSHLVEIPPLGYPGETIETKHPDTLGWPVPGEKEKTGCWKKMSGRKKFWLKLVIAVLVVGSMIGIALGISISVNAPVWRSKYRYENI